MSLKTRRIIDDIDDYGDILVVFGGGADHGGPAYIDVFDGLFPIGALGDGCFEWIEIDDEQIDRIDAMRAALRLRVRDFRGSPEGRRALWGAGS